MLKKRYPILLLAISASAYGQTWKPLVYKDFGTNTSNTISTSPISALTKAYQL